MSLIPLDSHRIHTEVLSLCNPHLPRCPCDVAKDVGSGGHPEERRCGAKHRDCAHPEVRDNLEGRNRS